MKKAILFAVTLFSFNSFADYLINDNLYSCKNELDASKPIQKFRMLQVLPDDSAQGDWYFLFDNKRWTDKKAITWQDLSEKTMRIWLNDSTGKLSQQLLCTWINGV